MGEVSKEWELLPQYCHYNIRTNVLKVILPATSTMGAAFSVNSQITSILGLVGHKISCCNNLPMLLQHECSTDNGKQGYSCVPSDPVLTKSDGSLGFVRGPQFANSWTSTAGFTQCLAPTARKRKSAQ